jgi:hypothetical protein
MKAPNATPITIISGSTMYGLTRPKQCSGSRTGQGNYPSHRKINPASSTQNHHRHPNCHKQKATIIDEQIEKHLWLLHGRIQPTADKEDQEEDGKGRE